MTFLETVADAVSKVGNPVFELFEKYWWVLILPVLFAIALLFKWIKL